MRKNPIDKVEIVEPPLGELSKKTYTWRRSCFTSIFSIILFIGLLFGLARIYLGSGPKVLTSLPGNFPGEVPVYDQDNVQRITYIPGRYKEHGLALTAFIPKIFISPTFYNLDGATAQNGFAAQEYQAAKGLWDLLAKPETENLDTVRVEWNHLDAEPQFVASYYINQLKNAGYTGTQEINTAGEKQFSFVRGKTRVNIYARGAVADHPGTDYAILTVHVPAP